MRSKLWSVLVAVFLPLGCGGSVYVPGGGGAGGRSSAESSSGTTTSASTSSSSSSTGGGGGNLDGGPLLDAGTDAGCSTCAEAVGPQHVLDFCPAAFGVWAACAACGCAPAFDGGPGGACEPVCGGGGWCKGVYPLTAGWTDPTPQCAACLAAKGTGCWDYWAECLNN